MIIIIIIIIINICFPVSFLINVAGMAVEELTTHTVYLPSKDEKNIWLQKLKNQIAISNAKKSSFFFSLFILSIYYFYYYYYNK